MGHDLSLPVQHGQARLARRLRAGGARDREDGALDRGRVRPQAADDEPRLADRPARRDALAARLRAALRAHDRSRTACCATPSPFLHVVAFAAERRAVLGEGRGLRGRRSRPRSRCWLGRAAGGRVRARPLLIARYYVLTTRLARRSGCGTGCATARRAGWEPAGGHAVIRARSDVVLAARRRCSSAAPVLLLAAMRGDPARDRAATRSTASGAWAGRRAVRHLQAAHDGRTAPSAWAPGWRSTRATRASRASARFLRRISLDELPNLVNVLRGEMSIVGPRPTVPVQVEQYTERQRGRLAVKPGITGWAQVNGRASLPWAERIELDLWYVEHRSLRLDLRILARTVADARAAARASTRARRADGAVTSTDAGVLLTGVGKRYDIVAAFAQHATVVAADPNPLAPAQYAAHVAPRRAAHRRPRLRPGAGGAVRRARRRRRRAAHRPRHRGPRRARAPTGRLPALVPDPEIAAATYDKYETHLLLERLGLPSPPTVLPGERVAVLPGDGQAAPGLGRALDPPGARRRARRTSSSATSTSR